MIRGERSKIDFSLVLAFLLVIVLSITASFTSVDSLKLLQPKAVKAMTYNIKFDNPDDKSFDWEARKNHISQTISSNLPDVLGLQGCYFNQVKWLEEELDHYEWYAVGSEDGEFRGEFCPILYNKQKFEKVDQGTVWLSKEESTPGSKGWDADEPAVLTWVKIKNILTQEDLFVFNTRLPFNKKAKLEGSKLLISKIEEISSGALFILTGDFNSQPEEENIQLISKFCKEASSSSFLKTSTINHTFIEQIQGGKILKTQDYVFFSNEIPVNSYDVLDNRYNDEYPSDHLPVLCKLRFP